MDLEVLKELAAILGVALPIGVLVAVILVTAALPQVEAAVSVLCRILGPLGPAFRKNAVGREVRSRVLKASGALGREIGVSIMPADLRVRWVREETCDAFLKDNCAVILLRYSPNPSENIIRAVGGFVAVGLVPQAKVHLDRRLGQSLDIAMTRKILDIACREALPLYVTKVLHPLLERDEELRETVETLFQIDNAGMLTQILIRELVDKSDSLAGQAPDQGLAAETREFVRFLYTIAARRAGEPPAPLQFLGVYYKVAIPIVGISDTIERLGTRPHIAAIGRALEHGVETVYVLAAAPRKPQLREIQNAMKSDARIRDTSTFPVRHLLPSGRRASGICLRLCTLPRDHVSLDAEPQS